MSGRLKNLNTTKRSRKLKCTQVLEEARRAKKVRLSEIIDTTHPISTTTCCSHCGADSRVSKHICKDCGSQDVADTNRLFFGDHEPLSDIRFGINSMRDSAYRYVLRMM